MPTGCVGRKVGRASGPKVGETPPVGGLAGAFAYAPTAIRTHQKQANLPSKTTLGHVSGHKSDTDSSGHESGHVRHQKI